MLKVLFVLETFPFLSWLFSYAEKEFEKKTKFNLKIQDVTDWGRDNFDRLPNISRSKENQAIKCGNLIKYNARNIFFQKSYKRWSRKTSSLVAQVKINVPEETERWNKCNSKFFQCTSF